MRKFLSFSVFVALVVVGHVFLRTDTTLVSEKLLNPTDFNLPATAKEVVEKRTEQTATFELSPGKFAAVSDSSPLFAHSSQGKLVIAGSPDDKKDICSEKSIICLARSLFSKAVPFVWASSSGPNDPGTLSDDSSASGSTLTWTNPGNANANDSAYATATQPASGTPTTHYINATNFGFNLPSTATVDGVVVEVERKCSGNGTFNYCVDSVVKLIKGGAVSGNTKADTVTKWPTSDAYATFGSSSDLWGVSLLYSDINALDFGVVFSALIRASNV